MRIATWNVNGIRAREQQVRDWLARDRPDVVCLQELKATPAQVPASLAAAAGYWCHWHGHGPYSGVGLLLSKAAFPAAPAVAIPELDFETRIVTARAGDLLLASVYVPNGGKDLDAKLRFLATLADWAAGAAGPGGRLVLCGDLNVTRTDRDVHPKERKPGVIGQRPDERAALERLLAGGLTDVGRALAPDDDALFTWWAPWRGMRQKNIGWRIDYVLASAALAASARACVVERDTGTSDHAPVVADLGPG
jgi:exodeoxyribonuclease-3